VVVCGEGVYMKLSVQEGRDPKGETREAGS